ncbi:MAG: hypothetical protein ABSH36_13605 [Solirubrobacteraceae bacterium]
MHALVDAPAHATVSDAALPFVVNAAQARAGGTLVGTFGNTMGALVKIPERELSRPLR